MIDLTRQSVDELKTPLTLQGGGAYDANNEFVPISGMGHAAKLIVQLVNERAALQARVENAAQICDFIAQEAFREARENTFLTDAGRSAYTSKAVGAEECALALRHKEPS